jgi:hypothetical protein
MSVMVVAPLTKRSSAGYILNFLAWIQAETKVCVARTALSAFAQNLQACFLVFQVQELGADGFASRPSLIQRQPKLKTNS